MSVARDDPKQRLPKERLTPRNTLVVVMAAVTGAGGGVLMWAAGEPTGQTVLEAVGVAVAALKFFDDINKKLFNGR